MFRDIEKKLGLPPVSEISGLLTGEKGKLLDRILLRLERLSKNPNTKDMAIILDKLKELDERGTLERVDRIFSKLPSLTRGDILKILGKIEKIERIVEVKNNEKP